MAEHTRHDFRWVMATVRIALATGITGCGGCFENADGPESLPLLLPDGARVIAERGSGVPSVADSRWELYRAEDDALVAVIEFGDAGELLGFEQNAFYRPDMLGKTLIPDGQIRETPTEGLTCAGWAYGAENSSGFGVATRLTFWLLGEQAAWGRIELLGSRQGDGMEGSLKYVTHVASLTGSPVRRGVDGQFAFHGVRVTETAEDASSNGVEDVGAGPQRIEEGTARPDSSTLGKSSSSAG